MCRGGALRPSMQTLGGEAVGGHWGRSPVRPHRCRVDAAIAAASGAEPVQRPCTGP